MSLRKLLCSLMLPAILLLSAQVGFAQTRTVSGKITDARDASGLPQVSVVVKGTSTGTTTDEGGNFTLSVPESARTLVFSAVGFASQEVAIPSSGQINVSLSAATNTDLNEVVVVGYGTAKKKDITGAVTKVTSREFNTGNISNPLQQVQGKVAGLVIVQPGSDPNSNLTVRLRGSTSLEGQPPLLVIDGVAIDDFNRGINSIAPNDIESYDILRDASSAAIYGSRGANGVIIITTKKGRSGKTQVDYSGFVSMESVSNKLDMLSAAQWRAKVGTSALDRGANTDWQDVITRDAFTQNHTIGISGGASGFSYRASINYIKNQGVVVNTGRELMSARFTATQKSLNDKLNIQFGLNATQINRDQLPDQVDARFGGSGIFNLVYNYLPVWPVYNADGSYFQVIDFDLENPLFRLKEIKNKRRDNFYQGNFRLDYEILKGLKIGTFGAMSRANDINNYFEPRIPEKNNQNIASISNFNKEVVNFDIHGNYRKDFGKHTLDLTGVYEWNRFLNDGFNAGGRDYTIPGLQDNNLGAGNNLEQRQVGSYKNEVRLISFLARAVYSFDNRYSATVNFRRDGSSKFGKNNRWGNFPSVGVAWTVSNEKFFEDVKFFNMLKFRVNYGLTGNQESLGPYPNQQLYGTLGGYVYNDQIYQSYGVSQLANPDLKWEVRKSFNIGLDMTILNNRLNATIDVFNDKTEDLLFRYDLPQPPFVYNQVVANAANATNKGVEVTLDGRIIQKKNFTYSARLNVGTLKNKITNLSGQFQGADLQIVARNYGFADGRGLSNAYVTRLVPGYTAGVFWIHQFAGLNDQGQQLYNDYDANGKLVGTTRTPTDEDRVYIDPQPKFSWGFTNDFTFGNFDLSIFLRGIQGQKVFANTLLNLETTTRLPGNNVTTGALTNGITEQPQPSDYWLRNASFARLENLTLGYNIRSGKIKQIEYLRLYVAANNLFVITDYEGIDPEIKVEGDRRYIDRNFYPKTRSFTVGVNVNFK
jgi:TonB-dependent starch-binding outer membrane protein SusC